jgi:hypothetical protein
VGNPYDPCIIASTINYLYETDTKDTAQSFMCRGNTRNKSNGKRQRIILASVVLTVLLLTVWFCLIPHMFFVESVDLPVHASARTVVSVSTFSQRVFQMRRCLDSIFEQSQVPDRVIITIPRKFRTPQPTTAVGWSDTWSDPVHHNETEVDMVAWFSDYVGAPPAYHVNANVHRTSYVYDIGMLTVQFVDDDWGPGTKLVGALLLETDPDTVVITLDDDVVYNRDTVQWLATHIKENTALSFACEMLNIIRSDTVCFGQGFTYDFFMTVPRVCDGWLMGWAGVAYHVSSFGLDIWTFAQSLPAHCFNNDDMWLSAYLELRGVTRVLAPTVIQHQIHSRNVELSLSTIRGYRQRATSCAVALFSPTRAYP